MGWTDGDGGFLWLVGNILSTVDSGFDYQASAIGTGSVDDGEYRYVESRRNNKGEREYIGVIETYRAWQRDNRNVNDLRDLGYPDQSRQPWWW